MKVITTSPKSPDKPLKVVSLDEVIVEIQQDCYFDLRAASKYSGLSIRQLHHIPQSELPRYRPFSKVYVKRSELDAFMKRHQVAESNDLDAMASKILSEFRKTR